MKRILFSLVALSVLLSAPCFADSYNRIIKFEANNTRQLFERVLQSIMKRRNYRLVSYDRKKYEIEAVCATVEVNHSIVTGTTTNVFRAPFKFVFQTINAKTSLTFDGDTGVIFDIINGPNRMRNCFEYIIDQIDTEYTYEKRIKKFK